MEESLDIVYEKKSSNLLCRGCKRIFQSDKDLHFCEKCEDKYINKIYEQRLRKVYKLRTKNIEPFGGGMPSEYNYVYAFLKLRHWELSHKNLDELTNQTICYQDVMDCKIPAPKEWNCISGQNTSVIPYTINYI